MSILEGINIGEVIRRESNFEQDYANIYIAQEIKILIMKPTSTQSLSDVLESSLNLNGVVTFITLTTN